MREIHTAARGYRVHARERGGEWSAYAERVDTGDRFGLEWTAASEAEALDRLSRWLIWQDEHASALAQLQAVEREYHRAIADAAFRPETSDQAGRQPAAELQKLLLDRIDAERVRLDAVRARKPG